MNEYLKEFGDYMEKRQAIIDLYNAQMAKATTEGERLSLSATMKRELSELDIEAKKKHRSHKSLVRGYDRQDGQEYA